MIIKHEKYIETKYKGYSKFDFIDNCALNFFDYDSLNFFKGEVIYVKLHKNKKLMFYRPCGPAEFGARGDSFFWYTNGNCFRSNGPSIMYFTMEKIWNTPDSFSRPLRKGTDSEERYWNW